MLFLQVRRKASRGGERLIKKFCHWWGGPRRSSWLADFEQGRGRLRPGSVVAHAVDVRPEHGVNAGLIALARLAEIFEHVAVNAHVERGLGLRHFNGGVVPIHHQASLVRVGRYARVDLLVGHGGGFGPIRTALAALTHLGQLFSRVSYDMLFFRHARTPEPDDPPVLPSPHPHYRVESAVYFGDRNETIFVVAPMTVHGPQDGRRILDRHL